MAEERNPLRITVAPTDREGAGYGVYDWLRGVAFPGLEAMRQQQVPGYFGPLPGPSLIPSPEGKLPQVGGVSPEALLGITDLLQMGMPMGKGAAVAAPFLPGALGKALKKGTSVGLEAQLKSALGKIPVEAPKASEVASKVMPSTSTDPADAALKAIEEILGKVEPQAATKAVPSAKPQFSTPAYEKLYEQKWKELGKSPSLADMEEIAKKFELPKGHDLGAMHPWQLIDEWDEKFGKKYGEKVAGPRASASADELWNLPMSKAKVKIAELSPEKQHDLAMYFTERYGMGPDVQKELFGGVPPAALSDEAISKALEKNPGASIFDLAGVEGTTSKAPLSLSSMKKTGDALGSNPGGFYEHPESGTHYYVKETKSPEHAKNERLAAALYNLGETKTLDYVPMAEPNVVATRLADLGHGADKFTKSEIADAQKDFAMHAWLANWDVAGVDNSNLRIRYGFPTVTDTGGALLYRAQGSPKGSAFRETVGEWDSLRDPNVNPQTAKLFSKMTDVQLKASAKKVLDIPDDVIYNTVLGHGLPADLADTLIARKKDIGKRLGEVDGKLSDPYYQLPSMSKTQRINYFRNNLVPFDWMSHQTTDLPIGLENVSAKHARELGFNPNAPLYKGGSFGLLPEFPNLENKSKEKGNFFAAGHEKHIAIAYGNPLPYVIRAPKAASIDWKKVTGRGSYSATGEYMDPIIEAARKEGYDLLRIDNIVDTGSHDMPHSQYVVLHNRGIRAPQAAFNPLEINSPNVLSGLGGAALASPLLLPKGEQK